MGCNTLEERTMTAFVVKTEWVKLVYPVCKYMLLLVVLNTLYMNFFKKALFGNMQELICRNRSSL